MLTLKCKVTKITVKFNVLTNGGIVRFLSSLLVICRCRKIEGIVLSLMQAQNKETQRVCFPQIRCKNVKFPEALLAMLFL